MSDQEVGLKIKCVKVTRPATHAGKWCLYRLGNGSWLLDELDGDELGDEIVIQLCEMTEEELSTIPDFDGW